jgi:hypothetical protein
MQSDFETAAWADSRKHFNAAVTALFDKVAYAFQRLQAINYDAPWEREKSPPKGLPQSCHN